MSKPESCSINGWSCYLDLPRTTIAAAACRSIFARAIIERLSTEADQPLLDPEDNEYEWSEEERRSFAVFTRMVYQTLLEIDRRAYKHQLTSRVHNEALSRHSAEATIHNGDSQEPGTSGLPSNTSKGLTALVQNLAPLYLESYPGRDDTAPDGALHNLLHRIMRGEETQYERIALAHQTLEYRFHVMTMGDKYVELMGLSPPKNQDCYDFDTRNLTTILGEQKYNNLWDLVTSHCDVLFPEPLPEQGRFFVKGLEYLVATIHHAGLSRETAVEKLNTLSKLMKLELDQETELMLLRDANLRSKRQKLFHAFGRAVRSLSPTKRNSLSPTKEGSGRR